MSTGSQQHYLNVLLYILTTFLILQPPGHKELFEAKGIIASRVDRLQKKKITPPRPPEKGAVTCGKSLFGN